MNKAQNAQIQVPSHSYLQNIVITCMTKEITHTCNICVLIALLLSFLCRSGQCD